ncbi:LarC family nickel insertion protein, partial [bacterium]|nr:LarC family nickel insertion protein [bacterium]
SKIAEIEAKIHDTTPDRIHFHEIGAIDSIVDILGIIIILDYLNIDNMYFISPIPVGKGLINTAHGILPSFAPATAKLLEGKPLEFLPIESEMITPTGALFLHFSSPIVSPCTPVSTGYGAGIRKYKNRPNILRIFFCETDCSINTETIIELDTNIDDMSPQSLSVFYQMIGTIALDVFITPVFMKKNRPGFKITVLTEKSNLKAARDFIFSNSTTTGIRYSEKPRFIEKRIVSQISTPYGIINIKLLNLKVIPEFDDCLKASKKYGIPVYKIIEEVRQIATTKS